MAKQEGKIGWFYGAIQFALLTERPPMCKEKTEMHGLTNAEGYVPPCTSPLLKKRLPRTSPENLRSPCKSPTAGSLGGHSPSHSPCKARQPKGMAGGGQDQQS